MRREGYKRKSCVRLSDSKSNYHTIFACWPHPLSLLASSPTFCEHHHRMSRRRFRANWQAKTTPCFELIIDNESRACWSEACLELHHQEFFLELSSAGARNQCHGAGRSVHTWNKWRWNGSEWKCASLSCQSRFPFSFSFFCLGVMNQQDMTSQCCQRWVGMKWKLWIYKNIITLLERKASLPRSRVVVCTKLRRWPPSEATSILSI